MDIRVTQSVWKKVLARALDREPLKRAQGALVLRARARAPSFPPPFSPASDSATAIRFHRRPKNLESSSIVHHLMLSEASPMLVEGDTDAEHCVIFWRPYEAASVCAARRP